jgi:hypothetical protein
MLPAIVPSIFTSWKVNISLAIRVVTIAELVGAVTGIGHQLSVAQELFSVADVFAWTLVLVALLFLLEALVARVETRLLAVARMSGPPPIEARGLRKVFHQATTGQAVVAIERLDLSIAPREVVAIVGQTGCGKSTFFDLAIGLEAPTEGSLRIGDKSPHADFDHFRGKIATVFQQDRLLPWRSALDNARLPLELIGLARSRAARPRAHLAQPAGARQFHQCLSARVVRRHAPAGGDCACLRGAARHPAGRRGVRPSRRGHPRRNCVRPSWRWRANAARPRS